ncbi:MAG: phytoene/squalene synthase family protein [Chryseolinea sp.]
MKEIFDKVSIHCSRITTHAYSTSFSLGIKCLAPQLRDPIYAIYGFVRFADEIVDTFHDFDKKDLLSRFKHDTYSAIKDGISLNPILNSFQAVYRTYKIEEDLVEQFLRSMEMDLTKINYDPDTFNKYVLGSAEVVGLMCLRVFCQGNANQFDDLKPYAMRLGAAFQKINFLRDMKVDYLDMGRSYFPEVEMQNFNDQCKLKIEESIKKDFEEGFKGIRQLPRTSRLGVYVAYVYYLALYEKIRNTPSEAVLKSRISIWNGHKAGLLAYSYVKHRLHLI